MSQIKGPAIFLAQFMGDEAPFNTLPNITAWAKELGYKGVQIPSWDSRVIDIKRAAESKTYCDDLKGQTNGLEITELASHLQGQMVASHPAYDELFDGFAAPEVRGNPKARAQWAAAQMKLVVKASKNLGLTVSPSFTGALLWPMMYPGPQRPAGLVEEGFKELAKRWRPIFDYADRNGVDIAFELHPGEDLHDGCTFERLLAASGNHPRLAINYDRRTSSWSAWTTQLHRHLRPHIKAFHERRRVSRRPGAHWQLRNWKERRPVPFPGRWPGGLRISRASRRRARVRPYRMGAAKDATQGAAEGAPFIQSMLIDVEESVRRFRQRGFGRQTQRHLLGLS